MSDTIAQNAERAAIGIFGAVGHLVQEGLDAGRSAQAGKCPALLGV
jgi:hypothetical protein